MVPLRGYYRGGGCRGGLIIRIGSGLLYCCFLILWSPKKYLISLGLVFRVT